MLGTYHKPMPTFGIFHADPMFIIDGYQNEALAWVTPALFDTRTMQVIPAAPNQIE